MSGITGATQGTDTYPRRVVRDALADRPPSCMSSVVRPTRGASYAPAVVEILTSRVLLRPTDLGRSLRFYEQTVGLAIYREWGSGSSRGVLFFLGGGGLLELSGGGGRPASDALSLVLQVRDVHATREHLVGAGDGNDELPFAGERDQASTRLAGPASFDMA